MDNAQGPRAHDAAIIPEILSRMWGTDATLVISRLERMARVFVAVDHFVEDVVGIYVAWPGTCFEALESINQGIRNTLARWRPTLSQGWRFGTTIGRNT